MVLIDLTTGDSADLTQGFGPFDFVPSDTHCFEDMMDDDTKYLQRVYPSGIAKLENGGVALDGADVSMRPMSLLNFPPEDRNRVYQSLVDELRNRPEGDALDTQLSSAAPGIRFIIADKTFDAAFPSATDPFVAVVAQPPNERNMDHRVDPGDPPQRLDVFETFKALRSGEIDRQDLSLPHCWRKTPRLHFSIPDDQLSKTHDDDDDEPDSSEESEAELSDAHSDSSGWDSDQAEVIVNLRRAQQQPDGWQPDALLSARLQESEDTAMTDDDPRPGPAPLRMMIDPRAALDEKCLVHKPAVPSAKRYSIPVCSCFSRHPSVYDDVRALAQSHPTVAAELGALVWRDAVVEVDDPAALLRFAQERPAALPMVKGLVLTLDCGGTDLDTNTGDLEAAVEMVERQGLVFKMVVVQLHTDLRAGEESSVGGRLREWGGLVRRLRTEGFAVGVSNLKLYHEGRMMTQEVEDELKGVVTERLLREWTPEGVEGRSFSLPLRPRGC
ncbi:hypothetical protein QBC39DRAFT_369590 [Podospora conica]|nr:hypothetical protein QBC39DRAFT_369590 [Schizothecium conicum]